MEEIAQVYARSLFEVASEQSRVDVVREQLGLFADALEQTRDLTVFFFSPYFSIEEKKRGFAQAVSGADLLLVNTIELLIDNHRMPVIFRVRRAFEDLWREANKRLSVTITSAFPLDEATVTQITDRIGTQTDQAVELTRVVDPDILGGLIVRVGNSIADASIQTRLERLRRNVAAA